MAADQFGLGLGFSPHFFVAGGAGFLFGAFWFCFSFFFFLFLRFMVKAKNKQVSEWKNQPKSDVVKLNSNSVTCLMAEETPPQPTSGIRRS